jgi:hypothetical protein
MLARALERIEEQNELLTECVERIEGLEEYVSDMNLQLESLQDYAGVPLKYYEYSPDQSRAEGTSFSYVTLTREEWNAWQRASKNAEAKRNEERHQAILAQQGGGLAAAMAAEQEVIPTVATADEPEIMPAAARLTEIPPAPAVDAHQDLMPGEEGEGPMDLDSEGEGAADLPATANLPIPATVVAADFPAAANLSNPPTVNIIPPTPQPSLESITGSDPSPTNHSCPATTSEPCTAPSNCCPRQSPSNPSHNKSIS